MCLVFLNVIALIAQTDLTSVKRAIDSAISGLLRVSTELFGIAKASGIRAYNTTILDIRAIDSNWKK